MLFYVYVTGKSTVFKMMMMVRYTKKISIQINRNGIKSITMNKSACVTNSTDGCKFKIVKLKPVHKLERTALLISMLNGWNQIGFVNILWEEFYLLFIYDSKLIKHRSFIPWNTTLPSACAMQDQQVARNSSKVNYFELNMDFTYGQMYGLDTVLSCFRKIISENNVNVTIDGTYTEKYTIAKFEVQGERSAKNEFYKLLSDRTKSRECIEYSCIRWNRDASEDNITDTSDSATNKKLIEKKLNKAAAGVKKAIDALKEISTFKNGPFSAINKLIEKLKEAAAGIKELIDASEDNKSNTPERTNTNAPDPITKGPVPTILKGRLNTERADSLMQKSIVYFVAIAMAALLFIAAGVFAFKTQQDKPQKDLCTDQSVLRKWSNES